MGLAALVAVPALADDQDRFQGTWKIASVEVGKKTVTGKALKQMRVTIEGDKLSLKEGEKTEVVHFTLNETKTPHHIDFYKTSAKKDRVWHGIYEFTDSGVRMCWGPAGEPRPKDHTTSSKNKNRVYVLKK
jgi:uncharacterized protein (TIGR03067 family)